MQGADIKLALQRRATFGRTAFAVCATVGLFGATAVAASAKPAAPDDADEKSTNVNETSLELNSPVTRLRSLALEYEYFTHQGELPGSDDQTGSRVVLTPSWPIRLKNGRQLQLRATIPINGDLPNWKPESYLDYRDFIIRKVPTDEPRIDPANGGEFGYGHNHLGNVGFDVGYGIAGDNGGIGMFGLAVVLPTSEDGSGRRGQYLIGPEVALGKRTAQGLYGFRLKHLTDVYGQGGQELGKLPTNETTLQVFLAYSFGNGWQLESNPTILYDWEAVSGNQWLVPIGGGISKTFSVGKRPMKLGVELQHYIESPERFGPEWLLRVNFIPLVSTKFLQ